MGIPSSSRASRIGTSAGTTVRRQGLLVIRAKDEPALIAVVQTDPFWVNGIVENLQITQWDPLFGVFRDLSGNPRRTRPASLRPGLRAGTIRPAVNPAVARVLLGQLAEG
jgi:YCII-related domain